MKYVFQKSGFGFWNWEWAKCKLNKTFPNFCHFWWVEHAEDAVKLWKIIKNIKNLQKIKKRPVQFFRTDFWSQKHNFRDPVHHYLVVISDEIGYPTNRILGFRFSILVMGWTQFAKRFFFNFWPFFDDFFFVMLGCETKCGPIWVGPISRLRFRLRRFHH